MIYCEIAEDDDGDKAEEEEEEEDGLKILSLCVV